MLETSAETAEVRSGEALNSERLLNYLESSGFGGPIEVRQFPAGSSNLTYLIVLDQGQFVLRRPPFGNTVKTAHDMRREFDVLSKLSAVYLPAPKPIIYCEDESVIGSEFYLMERRHGIVVRGGLSAEQIPNDDAAAAVERFETDRSFQMDLCKGFIENMVKLHALDPEGSGLGSLGKPEGYNRRQVEGWTKRYFAATTHEWLELDEVIAWLNDKIPAESGASIIHNDYKFDNVMLDPNDLTRVTAVLDWEMVTIGDPLMDLGTTLAYWMSRETGEEMLSMPFNPRVLMVNVSRKQLADMYAEASGRELPDLLFYYVFGTFKIAVIAQQIYARYVKGFTKDERFAKFDRFVAALGKIGAGALSRGAI